MKQRKPFNYRDLQRIKAEEYQRFFAHSGEHAPYLNHLGEVEWMAESEAAQQHEFFEYIESSSLRIKKLFGGRPYPGLQETSGIEKELRLQFQRYLEITYNGGVSPSTAAQLPAVLDRELTGEEIENIPVTLDNLETVVLNTRILGSLGMVAVLLFAMAGYGIASKSSTPVGHLLIQSNIAGARVYLNGTQYGYSHSKIENVNAGNYKLTLSKPGYLSEPQVQMISITPDSTTTVFVTLSPRHSDRHGFLKVNAEFNDSKIYIDNDYYGEVGEQELLKLEEGDYFVVVEKSGYGSSPQDHIISVSAGDTTSVTVQQHPLANTATTAPRVPARYASRSGKAYSAGKSGQGSLQVSSSISGARIFLNGEDTGRSADHIFTGMSPGEYTVRVEKEGYTSTPAEATVQLGNGLPGAECAFELVKTHSRLQVRTSPVAGEILLDGKRIGNGAVDRNVAMGEHRLSFGDIPGYKTPLPRTINIGTISEDLTISYFPEVELRVEISENGSVKTRNCEVATGYNFENRGFSSSLEAGPEVVYQENLNNYYWKLGYAFPYRDRKGNDALKMTFTLPKELNHDQTFLLKVHAASSGEQYPFRLSREVDIKIRVNGRIVTTSYHPQSIESAKGMEELELDITRLVKAGVNAVEISTTEKNNTYYLVKRISIYN